MMHAIDPYLINHNKQEDLTYEYWAIKEQITYFT